MQLEVSLEVLEARNRKLRRVRRSRRPHVRNELGDGGIGLVTDAALDGHAAGGDGACDAFIVETPELFGASSAATQDDHIEIRQRLDATEGIDDRQRCIAPLRSAIDEDETRRCTA